MYIFSARALASCRRRPLSSNVRPHNSQIPGDFMQQQTSQSPSQLVVCASRSRLWPIVSLWGAPEGAQRAGRRRRIQTQLSCLGSSPFEENSISKKGTASLLHPKPGMVAVPGSRRFRSAQPECRCFLQRFMPARSRHAPSLRSSQVLGSVPVSKSRLAGRRASATAARGLTLRSSGAPTAGHQARPVVRSIFPQRGPGGLPSSPT